MKTSEKKEVFFSPYDKSTAFLRGLRTLFSKVAFINFVQDMTPLCDRVTPSGLPVVPDIGIFASTDIVAIDKASLDLTAQSKPLRKFAKIKSTDILGKIYNTDSLIQVRTAQELGLGSMEYQLDIPLRV